MVSTGRFDDGKELLVTHLADPSQPISHLHLYSNDRFLAFAEMQNISCRQNNTEIYLLLLSSRRNSVKLCSIGMEKPF